MATPIQPTPPLNTEDSERLRRDLAEVCSPEEAERRVRLAEERLRAAMMMPGTLAGGQTPVR
jgi:hypothetical protein